MIAPSLVKRLAARLSATQAAHELWSLSDRQLADIGLLRSEIRKAVGVPELTRCRPAAATEAGR